MAQSKREIQAYLAAAGAEPRKQFGQNFMIDQNLVRLVADAGAIGPDDTVIEVGPGTGTLTQELLRRSGRVIAVEIDRGLARVFCAIEYSTVGEFELIEGDVLDGKHALNPVLRGIEAAARAPGMLKLIANLPYNIASPLVIELLIAGVGMLVFTVQKEVADRLRAAAGTEAYGPLSVVAQRLAQVEVLRTLPPQAFWPTPKVDSALVRMTSRRSAWSTGASLDGLYNRSSRPDGRRCARRWPTRNSTRSGCSRSPRSTAGYARKCLHHSNLWRSSRRRDREHNRRRKEQRGLRGVDHHRLFVQAH